MKRAPASSPAFYRWASLRMELFWAYDGIVSPDALHMATDNRGHAYWAWLLRKGSVEISVKGKKWKATAGQWVVSTSPHGWMKQDFSEDAAILSIHFRCQWPTGENLFEDKGYLICEAAKVPQLERYGKALHQCIERYFPGVRMLFSNQPTKFATFLRLQRLFNHWLNAFSDVMLEHGRSMTLAANGDERLLRAVNVLHETATEGVFPVKLLRAETGLGRAHLDRLFWREFGVTTREYWDRLREESARGSLEGTALSIKEVGYHLGFRQASHFTKWFLRRSGTTPTEHREEAIRKRQLGHL